MVRPPRFLLVANHNEERTFQTGPSPRERTGAMRISCPSPKDEVCEHESPNRSVPAGAFFLGGGSCPMLTTPALRSSRMRSGRNLRIGRAAWIAEPRAFIRQMHSGKR